MRAFLILVNKLQKLGFKEVMEYNENGTFGKIYVKGEEAIKIEEFDASELDEE